MTAADATTRLAEGAYSYTIDDRPHATEVWRLNRLADDRLHMQSILGQEQRMLYAMDLVISTTGTPESLSARVGGTQGEMQATFAFTPGRVHGQRQEPTGATPFDLALPSHALPFPESIAMRFLLGRALNLTDENEQTVPLCVIPVFSGGEPLLPQLVMARATVMGTEDVDLLMATVPATRVLIEWPNHPPQHGWFDARRFPVQWYWVGRENDGATTAHEHSLTRYAWHIEA